MIFKKRTPRFLRDDENERRQKSASRHEKAIAKALDGIETVGSGNKSMKADVWAGRHMVECKATKNKSMSIKLSWLEKLVKEAFEAGKLPVLTVRFDSMSYEGAKDWAMIPLDRLQELLEKEDEHDGRQ